MSETCEELQFTISSSFEAVADLAERVSTVCAPRYGRRSDVVDTLRLCLAEALNNIVEHAYDGADGRPIFARVQLRPSGYDVVLVDEGKPMPGGTLPAGRLDFDNENLDFLPEGGFGWVLIRSQMDAIDYERRGGRNVLRLSKRFGA